MCGGSLQSLSRGFKWMMYTSTGGRLRQLWTKASTQWWFLLVTFWTLTLIWPWLFKTSTTNMSPNSTRLLLSGCVSTSSLSTPLKITNKTSSKLPLMTEWRATTLTVCVTSSLNIWGNSKPSEAPSPGPVKSGPSYCSESLSAWIVALSAKKSPSSLSTLSPKSVSKTIATRLFGSWTLKDQYLQISRKSGCSKTLPKSQQEPCPVLLTWYSEMTTHKEANQETFYAL